MKKLKWAGWNKEGDVIWITPSGIMYRFKDLKRNAEGRRYEKTEGKLHARYEGQPRVKLLPKTNKKGEQVLDDRGNFVFLGFYESELEGLKKCEYCSDKMATPSSDGDESGTAGSDRYGGIPVGDPANTDYSKMGQGYGMPPGGYIDSWGPVIDKGPVLGGSWGGGNWNEGYGYDTRTDGGGDGGGEKKTPINLTPPAMGVRRFPVDPVPDIKTPPVWIVPRDIIDTGPVTGGKKPETPLHGLPNKNPFDKRRFFVEPRSREYEGYYDPKDPDPAPKAETPTIKEIIDYGKKNSATFNSLVKAVAAAKAATVFAEPNKGTATRFYDDGRPPEVILQNDLDLKTAILHLTHEYTNVTLRKQFVKLITDVSTGKITPNTYATKAADMESAGVVNQVKVAAEMGIHFPKEQVAMNSWVDAYKNNRNLDFSKLRSSNTFDYKQQAQKLRSEYLKNKR